MKYKTIFTWDSCSTTTKDTSFKPQYSDAKRHHLGKTKHNKCGFKKQIPATSISHFKQAKQMKGRIFLHFPSSTKSFLKIKPTNVIHYPI